jgi:hypothetical protein
VAAPVLNDQTGAATEGRPYSCTDDP